MPAHVTGKRLTASARCCWIVGFLDSSGTIVLAVDQFLYIGAGPIEGSLLFHLQTGEGGGPDARLPRRPGEAHANIGAETSIAPPAAPVQACRVELQRVVLAAGMDQHAIFVGQND